MKKTIFPALVFLALSSFVSAQHITQAFIVKDMHLTSVLHDSKGFIYAFGTRAPGLEHNYIPYFGYETPTFFKIRKYDPANGAILWERSVFSAKVLSISTPRIIDDEIFLAGYFRDTVSGDFGTAISNGNNDFLFAKLDENGQSNLVTGGGPGDELLDCLVPDGAGGFYISGRLNGDVMFNNQLKSTFTEQHSFLCHSSFAFFTVNWTRYAKATLVNGVDWGLASFFGLNKTNDFLYSLSRGKSVMLDTNCDFGSLDYADASEKWNLQGRLIGRIPVGGTYSNHSVLLGTDVSGNYYTAHNQHYKGPSTLSIRKYNSKGDSMISQNIFEEEHFLLSALTRSGKYLLATYGQSEPGKNWSNNIIEGDIVSGTKERNFSFDYPTYGMFPFSMINYTNNNLLIFGEMPEQLNFGTYTLTGGDKDSKQDYIALLTWPTLTGISETTQNKAEFSVAPNPGSGYYKITAPENIKNGSIRVFAVNGEKIYEKEILDGSNFELNIPFLAPGVYFVELRTENTAGVKKLLVQ